MKLLRQAQEKSSRGPRKKKFGALIAEVKKCRGQKTPYTQAISHSSNSSQNQNSSGSNSSASRSAGNSSAPPAAAICGDNHIDSGEACDGTSLLGSTCQTIGFVAGTLRCKQDCSDYDTSPCIPESSTIGQTYYISPQGNDSNPGTISAPFKSLYKATRVLSPGDFLYLRQGTHNVRDVIGAGNTGISFPRSGQPGAPITVAGYPGERPILDNANLAGAVFELPQSGYSNFSFKNMIIQNAEYGIRINPATAPVTDIRVENIEFKNGRSGIRAELYAVQRMYITGASVHDMSSDQGGFDFKVNVTNSACGAGSQNIIVENTDFYNIDWQTASGSINQESTKNFIYLNNTYRTTNRDTFGKGGGKMFESKSGGYNIYLGNYGYGTSDAVYYLSSPYKTSVGVSGCGKANHLMINNVGIISKVMDGEQGAITKWGDANLWAYANTLVSPSTKTATPSGPQGYGVAAIIYSTATSVGGLQYPNIKDIMYLKNNIAFRASDPNSNYDCVIRQDANNFNWINFLISGNLFYTPNDSSGMCLSQSAGSLRQYETWSTSPNTNAWADPGFSLYDPLVDNVHHDLHLQAGSSAINAGVPYSLSDPEDYPMKAQEFLSHYDPSGQLNYANAFADFTILSNTDKQRLRKLILEAYLNDLDGHPRTGNPDAGAFEK